MAPPTPSERGPERWSDAVLAATLLAVDGPALGGIRVRARAGPVRARWLAGLVRLCAGRPLRKLPLHAGADRLVGGLDLAATLRLGRPVTEPGLLEQADGGVLLAAMAERMDPQVAAILGMAMDTGQVPGAPDRDPPSTEPIRFAVVALDEGVEPDEATPKGLNDRLALQIDLDPITVRDLDGATFEARAVAAARARVSTVLIDEGAVETLCAATLALGIDSLRAPWLAARVARVSAALGGRGEVAEEDIATAARLVLAPRATRLPAPADAEDEATEPPEPEPESPPPESEPEPPPNDTETAESDQDSAEQPEQQLDPETLAELVLAAVRATIPEGLLDASRLAQAGRGPRSPGGKSGAQRQAGLRGRPAGVRRGRPGADARLNLVETLRAAAPWQKIRRAQAGDRDGPRVRVRQDDFRVTRFKARRETTTVFVVDASGSAALHRLAEAKGAVELLLADCYVRRDRVALISFRGRAAEVLLPPTRSLVQAKRRLAELPGGGGTPLACGLEAALELSDGIIRRGSTPVIVVLTDGRANVAADGAPGRARAHDDAISAAQQVRAAGLTVLMIDTSPRPRPLGEELAMAMGARYLPLPHADAAHLSAAVRAESQAG